ncbi:protein FAR1-RELATED SEQUENCE 7 [Senna tora]|uniref:Protein FAR1-RELATED SEQUENCE 7 n=1 Tax=Senna tora TaxID=362788 RepID=A0A834XCS0_9FABA|nr:protein FAR1-RELATED SEQUENCE 7 [Senna tora]
MLHFSSSNLEPSYGNPVYVLSVSMRDGKNVWRQLVCNKEERSENRKPRAETTEGCNAMIVVKKAKTGKWIVTGFIKEHNHPLLVTPANNRRSVLLSQTPILANKSFPPTNTNIDWVIV